MTLRPSPQTPSLWKTVRFAEIRFEDCRLYRCLHSNRQGHDREVVLGRK
jgi:hypothetical protein